MKIRYPNQMWRQVPLFKLDELLMSSRVNNEFQNLYCYINEKPDDDQGFQNYNAPRVFFPSEGPYMIVFMKIKQMTPAGH